MGAYPTSGESVARRAGPARRSPAADGTAAVPYRTAAAGAGLEVVERLLAGRGVAVLSGAGLSTESGIPDYRGATGSRRRGTPMTYQEFTGSEAARRRYWARSHVGWRAIAAAEPNAGHRAVEALRRSGHVSSVITQNVDGLHRAAGTADAVELHGGLDRVVCLGCRRTTARAELDRRLEALNDGFRETGATLNPDGDVELADARVAAFRIAPCEACGGVLKPDVVFFGEAVPKERVEQCYRLVDAARALLVLGSSLTVLSGLRFVRHAARSGRPVAIVNQGSTRGDDLAVATVALPLGTTLTTLAHRLTPPTGAPTPEAPTPEAPTAEAPTPQAQPTEQR
ncbi:NAD-dependent protein deacetylase [Kitasatospora sp. A2-31]|uniref:NAD-dependent protein deacetylase n=1 Tax=Kitasatospora sp. A2-31 TaxID=2916414 RepID=UPI001EEB2BF5|nr:NAD-dependent protein deacetylase [Kitasatospora sp. A2-31]MCG6497794.1 NAD-dependent protein deacetylase [Kitasatospora sp. A2-31]